MRSVAWMILGLLHGDSPVAAADPPMAMSIWAMDSDGANARELGAIPDYPIINSPEVSPDGKWVAVDGWKAGQKSTDAHVLLLNVETKETRDLGAGCMPSWSADGEWVAISKYAPRGVALRNIHSDVEHVMDSQGWAIQLSPDGGKAAYIRGGHKIVVDDFATNTQREYIPDEVDNYRWIMHNPRWSPDSKRIAFLGWRLSGKKEIAVLILDQQKPGLVVLCDASDVDPDIAWHPTDHRITFPRKPNKVDQIAGQLLMVRENQIGERELLPGQPQDRSNRGNCWTADGKTLIFVSNATPPWW
jgi:Tol biopolymer transport system component